MKDRRYGSFTSGIGTIVSSAFQQLHVKIFIYAKKYSKQSGSLTREYLHYRCASVLCNLNLEDLNNFCAFVSGTMS